MQESPYEIHNGRIGVRLSFIVSDADIRHEKSLGLIKYQGLKSECRRKDGFRLREGKGAGNETLVCWDMMRFEWQFQFERAFGDPKKKAKTSLLAKFYSRDAKAADFYAIYPLSNEKTLEPPVINEYTTNASVLNAVIALQEKAKGGRKALQMGSAGSWLVIMEAVDEFREHTGHTLKIPSLKRTLSRYKQKGYAGLISGKYGNQNTAKINRGEQVAMLEELLKKHNNLNNEQIKDLYNMAASRLNWKTISAATVANAREDLDLYTYSGRRGETNYRNNRAMQVKRRAPNLPMIYWSIDGWDAELLYQKQEINSKGHSVTTYHNRLTAVVVLDPCGKYPVGYAIGTHETTDLIKAALRDAANHTRELFGNRYKTLQLQSDHYGKGVLVPTYEAMTKHYTPARVKNAKAKVVEPYFKYMNTEYCQMFPNWSGFGVTSKKESQPNQDYLNKIRHQFPDEAGCRAQIVHIIEMERLKKRDEYIAKWSQMVEEDRLLLSDIEYLNLFGIHTGYTNRLEASGLNPTILGEKRSYDSFDIRFREMRGTDWLVKYDPDNLEQVLVVNAKSRNGKLEEEINTVQLLLEQKYVQPMALYDRKDGDAQQLQRVTEYNKQLEETIIERGIKNRQLLDDLFVNNPQLNDTLTKLILVDSAGQHKNNKNNARLLQNANRLEIKQTRKEVKQEYDNKQAIREAYIDSKIDINEFLNL